MKKNEKGSSLIYAVIVVMIITVTVAAALTISYTYYNRSLVNNSKRQSYLTAKSILTNLTEGVLDQEANYLAFIPKIPKERLTTITVNDDFPSEMGSIGKTGMEINEFVDSSTGEAIPYYKLTIFVTATYGGQTTVMNSDLRREKVTDKPNEWTFLRYYEGEIKPSHNIQIADDMKAFVNQLHNLEIRYKANDKDESIKKEIINFMNTHLKDSGYDNSGDKYVVTSKDFWKLRQNENIRTFVYYAYQKEDPAYLHLDEFTLPDNVKNKLNMNQKYYLHIMCGYGGVEPRYILMATPTKEMSQTNQDWAPYFVYLPETGHWYYNYNATDGSRFSNLAALNSLNSEETYRKLLAECSEENIAQ